MLRQPEQLKTYQGDFYEGVKQLVRYRQSIRDRFTNFPALARSKHNVAYGWGRFDDKAKELAYAILLDVCRDVDTVIRPCNNGWKLYEQFAFDEVRTWSVDKWTRTTNDVIRWLKDHGVELQLI